MDIYLLGGRRKEMNDKLISEAYIYILITCTCLAILGLIYECEVNKIRI